MAKIGEYRLRIFDLLYEKPICEYTAITEKKKQNNVLILGTGWTGNEAFKAAFWAGQALDTELNITVASQNALDYKKQVLSTKTGAYLPALKKYTQQKRYANLKFVNLDIKEGVDAVGLTPLDFAANRYTYIIVALGNAQNNWLAASELITQISEAHSGRGFSEDKVLVNVFDEFSDCIDEEERELLSEHGKENGIEVHFFGSRSITGSELERIARNVNFSYAMKYDQRIPKEEADRQFEESRIDEFAKAPLDYEVGDVSVAANFLGAAYAADSSFASAVHIPVKLAMCQEEDQEKNPLTVLKEAIQKKNTFYWRLVALEHRRWNAYMVMRGFRAPSLQEEECMLYQNGNTHQDKQHRLHLCLCDCGEQSALKNNFDRQYALWKAKKCPADFPSELDRASLRAHQLTEKLTQQIQEETIFEKIKGNAMEYINLRRAVLKLLNDEENSLVLYEKSLEEAKNYAVSVSEEELVKLKEIDRILAPVKIRNARMDFFSLDEQLLEMLPFALWYEKKYRTVITISDGMSTTTHDVIVPTLFCAQDAIFMGKAVNSKRYQKAITTYFEHRGGNTHSQFISLPVMDMDILYESLEQQIEKYGHHDLVINCVPNKGCDAALAVGRLIEKYPGEINAVQYIPEKGIVSFCADKNIGVGLDNKSFSLSEYIGLMGGRVTNEYKNLYNSQEYETLVELFRSYCEPTRYTKSNGKTGSFNTWACVTEFLSHIGKDKELEKGLKLEAEGEEQHYSGKFKKDVFKNSLIENTVSQLQNYRIIQNYCEYKEQDTVWVDFDYVNPEIGDLLQNFEQGRITEEDTYKSLKFIPLSGGLKISNRLVRNVPILKPEETEAHRKVKLKFLQELLQRGYIKNLSVNADDTASFAFKDEAIMHLMKIQGAVFELVVYYLMRESGQFDDVETGVKIAWDTEDTLPEQMLMEATGASKTFGYSVYIKARTELFQRMEFRGGQSVKNEIDIIALKGMNAIMVSCKTSDSGNIQWIYEIKAVSEHFQSTGVLALVTDYTNKSKTAFMERAKQMGVRLWGTETLWEKERLCKDIVKMIR